jgi:hypothetical protein
MSFILSTSLNEAFNDATSFKTFVRGYKQGAWEWMKRLCGQLIVAARKTRGTYLLQIVILFFS